MIEILFLSKEQAEGTALTAQEVLGYRVYQKALENGLGTRPTYYGTPQDM